MWRLKVLFVALPLAASACCKPADPFATRSTPLPPPPAVVAKPSIWKFEFSNVTAGDRDARPPVLPTVYVKITKYDADAGEVTWSRIHKEGESLGFDMSGTSVHAVFSRKKGRTVPVDFNCGGSIKRVLAPKITAFEYRMCRLEAGPGGTTCAGAGMVKDSFRVNEIVYSDDTGKTQVRRWPAGPGPKSDRLCPDHVGTPSLASEKEAQRRSEAIKLLKEADVLWESFDVRDLKEAQRKYKMLLNTFGDLTVVRPRLAELAHRSSQRVD